jgi:hypothetical protein
MLMFSIPDTAAGRGVLRSGGSPTNRIRTFVINPALLELQSAAVDRIADCVQEALVLRNVEIDGTCRVRARAEDPGKPNKGLSRNRKVGAENRLGLYSLRYSRKRRITASTKLWSGGSFDVDAVGKACSWLAAYRR